MPRRPALSHRIGVLIVLAAWIAGWTIVLLQPDGVLGGDVPIYFERVVAIEQGGLPYLDPVFEHLPGMLVPFFAARVLSGFGDSFVFSIVFTALMAGCVLVTTTLLDRYAGGAVSRRFLLLAAPLLPLVMFRSDAWVTLLAVAAISPVRHAGSFGVVAILSKGWPLVLAAREFVVRRWKRVWAYGIAGVGSIIVMLSPGFRATQEAGGLHSESLMGSFVGLRRMLVGNELGIEWTTAVYLNADPVLLVIGPLVALVVGGLGLVALRRGPDSLPLIGALVGAVIIASPLFSTQYVYWILPFAATALARATRLLAGGVAVLSLVIVLTWEHLFTASAWWWLVAGRNILFLGCVLALLVDGSRQRDANADSAVRTNRSEGGPSL